MNWKITILMSLVLSYLAFDEPELIPVILLLLPYYILLKVISEGRKKLAEIRDICLRQKRLAEQTEMPDPFSLLSTLKEITEKAEPNRESLAILVNFGCRLSLCDFKGRVVIDLENPDTNSEYRFGSTDFDSMGELLELPGLRGRQKDQIGCYRFWRTTGVVCFTHIENQTTNFPSFMIHFDPETLEPYALAVQIGLIRGSGGAAYMLMWGNRRGDILRIQ